MANDNHLLSVPCYNGTMLKHDYYNEFFELGQQKINFSFFELSLPCLLYTSTFPSGEKEKELIRQAEEKEIRVYGLSEYDIDEQKNAKATILLGDVYKRQ